MSETSNTHNFQAEVSRLLQMMVHSVYSEREVFLRELISNAADACDKLRYLSATESDLLGGDGDFKITLKPNKDAGTLIVQDNGIGMTKTELIENLGTIARSGTKAFMETHGDKSGDKSAEGDDKKSEDNTANSLIGQFGVGFYAAFMVADKVDVISRHAQEKETWKWSSDGISGFTIEEATSEEAPDRGTLIIMHLKDDAKKYLEAHELENMVRTYSDHISFPIELVTPAAPKEAAEGEEKPEEAAEDLPTEEVRQINSSGALWTRPKNEITQEQYTEFYHHVGGMYDSPSHTIHYVAEGRQSYTVLLFIPESKPFDLFEPNRQGHIKLYVRKVFITDKADLLPSYLRFVRGVIDSEDMPLNLSREMLQNNPVVEAIKQAVTKRVLKELATMATKRPEDYIKFWETFGPVIKEGIYEDMARRDELYELTRFRSTENDGWRSLSEYVEGLEEGQDEIFYLTGEDLGQMRGSPQLEGYKARGIEVLLLSDPVDSFWVTAALGFKGKSFKSITQGDVDLSKVELKDKKEDENEEDKAAKAEQTAKLLAKMKEILAEKVEDVRASQRLVDSPVCLVASENAPDRVLEKMLQMRQDAVMPETKPILEINTDHKLFASAADKIDASGELIEDLAWLMLDEARILEGGSPDDPAAFATRLNKVLQASL